MYESPQHCVKEFPGFCCITAATLPLCPDLHGLLTLGLQRQTGCFVATYLEFHAHLHDVTTIVADWSMSNLPQNIQVGCLGLGGNSTWWMYHLNVSS